MCSAAALHTEKMKRRSAVIMACEPVCVFQCLYS